MQDIVIVALLIVAFALAVTMHVVLTLALAKHEPRWRALVAFIIPPFAPYWAWREHMYKRASVWIGCVIVYLVMLVVASR